MNNNFGLDLDLDLEEEECLQSQQRRCTFDKHKLREFAVINHESHFRSTRNHVF